MRILHCIDTLGGGGAERQLTYLTEGLVRLGHEVDVVHLFEGAWAPRLRASGARLHPLGWRAPLPLLTDLYGIVRRRRIDVVQTWLGRMSAAGGVVGPLARRPWLYSERSVRVLDAGWRAVVRRLLVRGAAAVVANSEAGAALWRATAPGRVHVIPNGVELDAIAATPPAPRRALGVADDAELVVYAGRFAAPKNIPLLAAALVTLLRGRPRAAAICAGDGDELPAFQAAVARAGLAGRCSTPGFRADVWALIRAADVVIAPSLHEGRPNVVLEAMAGGCPLVLSDIAQHRECVPRPAALWFSPRAPAEAAAALAQALDDRAAAQARAARARAAVREHSVERMARAYADLYARLLEQERDRARSA